MIFTMSVLQEPRVFLSDFIKHGRSATKRIWIQAMVVDYGHIFSELEKVLVDAAKRGVDVRINVDWVTWRYVYGELDLLPSLSRDKYKIEKKKNELNEALFNRLRESGAIITVMNKPGVISWLFPVYGRNHIKMYAVDDYVWVGGLNFYDKALSHLDFLVRFDEPKLVSAVTSQFNKVNGDRPEEDYKVSVSQEASIIVDSGRRGVSLIYDEAYDLVSCAKQSIIFVSQLVPEGQILDMLLDKAEQGVEVTIITSNPEDSAFTKYPLRWSFLNFNRRIKDRCDIRFIHLDRKIHAKLIITDDREAIFGSHNFVDAGVFMGTEEIAVRTKNNELVQQLVAYVDNLLKKYMLRLDRSSS